MIYKISKNNKVLHGEINIVASKSESNRALIIQALTESNFDINNLSNSEDTFILKKALDKFKFSAKTKNSNGDKFTNFVTGCWLS